MKKYKRLSKISLILLLAMVLNMMMFPGLDAARLTAAKNTMSRIQVSGTGTATAGYTQSTQDVTDNFVIVTGINNIICLDTDGTLVADGTTTCTNDTVADVGVAGEVRVNLITNGGLISGDHYTGDQIATAIKTGLEAQDGDVNDVYTVTYDEAADRFTVRGGGANTLNPAIGWLAYTGADNAAITLGYTANDTNLRGANAVSDNAVAFNVVAGTNNAFNVRVDAEGPNAVTIAAGVYTATTLVTEMDTKIDAASVSNVVVSYANNRFRITSATTGAGSTIVVTEGGNDFLRTVRLNNDVPVDGEEAVGVVVSDHTISFTARSNVAAGGRIVVDFPAGFGLPAALNFEDLDLKIAGVDIALAGTASTTTWGVAVTTGDGGFITFTSGTGTITAGNAIEIEIGRNATFGVAGTEQISNPTTVGLYQILVKTTTSVGAIIDDTYIGVYIVPDDSVVITATVDPVLAMTLHGGTAVDFGTLEPNAYHKLGGAQNAYGHIDFSLFVADGANDTETITVRGIVYELSDDGVIAGTSDARVDIVDNENNYLTKEQVAANLSRAINNHDGTLVRANVAEGDTDRVYLMATTPGTDGNAYGIVALSAEITVSGANFSGGAIGYNRNSITIGYKTGALVGNNATGTNIVVSTNAVSGYVLTVQNSDNGLWNGTTAIPAWSGQYGWGIIASAQSARYGNARGNGTGNEIIATRYDGLDDTGADTAPGAMSSTATTLASYFGTAAGDNIAVEYNIRISPTQPAGLYTDTITYILTSTF